MKVPNYSHQKNVGYFTVPADEDFRVLTRHGWTVRVYVVELIDHSDGGRAVKVEGLHIRVDNFPGAHHRTGSWRWPEPLPANLRELVEDARPAWYGDTPCPLPPGRVTPAAALRPGDRFVPAARLVDAVDEGWHWTVVTHTYAALRRDYSTMVTHDGYTHSERLHPVEPVYRLDGDSEPVPCGQCPACQERG